MKQLYRLALLFLFSGITAIAFGQQPEPVYSFIRDIKDKKRYEDQAKAWKQEIDRGTKNKMAWVNFYRANRAMQFLIGIEPAEQIDKNFLIPLNVIVSMAEQSIPNSVEAHYLKAYNADTGSDLASQEILAAQRIDPYNKLLFPLLMNHYQFVNDKKNVETVAQKWFESNEMPSELIATAYNKLMSVDENAFLLVSGDNDTYPFWVLQQVQKVRTDVTIINVSLCLIERYRKWLFRENGIPEPVDSLKKPADVVKHLIATEKKRPIYFSIQMDKEFYKSYTNKMYLTGLAFKYSESSFDNLAVMQNNVENKFLLDFLKYSFYNNYAQTVVDQSNLSYMAVFLKLYDHYRLSGETAKASRIKELAGVVAERGKNTEWMKYFEK